MKIDYVFRYFRSKMPYLIVRESYVTDSCLVDGLPPHEIRLVTDRSSSSSELKDEKNRRVEFHTAATALLGALEHLGYKVRHIRYKVRHIGYKVRHIGYKVRHIGYKVSHKK